MARYEAHFKLLLRIMGSESMIEVYEDNDLLATYVRLGLLAIERYADRSDDSFIVSNDDLVHVAKSRPAANALRRLRKLCAKSPVSMEPHGPGWRITIPNLAQNQFQREAIAKRAGRTHTPAPLRPPSGPPPAPSALTQPDAVTPRKSRAPSGGIDTPSTSTSGIEARATSKLGSNVGSSREPSRAQRSRGARSRPSEREPAYAVALAKLLRDWIRKDDPHAKVPKPSELGPWAAEMRRMVDIDGRTSERIAVAIEWVFTVNQQSEAPFVIRSAKALRQKFDRMSAVARNQHRKEQRRAQRTKVDPTAKAEDRLRRAARGDDDSPYDRHGNRR